MGRDRRHPTVLFQDKLPRRPVNEKQLQALIRKTMAKAEKTAKKPGSWADPTLSATQSPERDDDEAKKIFKEMKKREF